MTLPDLVLFLHFQSLNTILNRLLLKLINLQHFRTAILFQDWFGSVYRSGFGKIQMYYYLHFKFKMHNYLFSLVQELHSGVTGKG